MGNNSDSTENPTPTPQAKRRGRPKGVKDTKPRKSKKVPKKDLEPEIPYEPIFPRQGQKGVLPQTGDGLRRNKPRPIPANLAVTSLDNNDNRHLPEDIFKGASPEISNHADWQSASPIERRFCYEYFASGFRLVESFRMIAGELGHGDPDEVLRRAKMYANRGPVVRALKVLVDYFLQDRKLVYAPKILAVLEAQAFYDPAEILDEEGGLRCKLSELAPHLRWCIKGIETKFFGKDADRSTTTVTLVDRAAALEKLSRYVSLFVEPGTTINVQNNVQNITHVLPEDSRARLSRLFASTAELRPKIGPAPATE